MDPLSRHVPNDLAHNYGTEAAAKELAEVVLVIDAVKGP
eukprot:SAG22_NODE_1531_length_4216_cov_3.079184_2_plen_39_part_00